ncbi:MAG: hypothetical protein RUMPE_00735 [Eubacteriales bacterium SKADARSKE-1]|nr:hypothetical protein [Eubacteriales bacterium SKADARSKE-1]
MEASSTNGSTVFYSDFSSKYIDDIIDIGTQSFGENYITREEILKHIKEDNEMCTLAIDADTNEVLGYCLFFEENMDSAQKDFKIPKEELISITGSNSNICHAKSIAVRKNCESKGIGYNLFEKTLNKAKKMGYKIAWCPAWKRGDFIPAEKVLLKSGFKYFKTVSNMWEKDKSYKCIDCKGPCKCDAAIYYKLLN